jgi:PEGA domain
MRPLINAVTRTTILAAVFIFALAASVAAAPQRGGGGHFGGAHFGGGGPRGHFNGGVFIGGGFFDPFWGPYYPYGYGYPYAYGYPYGVYGSGSVRTEIKPKQTQVYVDGYYAGVADDFDGAFQRLHTTPGGHTVTLRLEGYRTVTENIYVRPDSTAKLKETMEKLAPGEASQPVPLPTRPAARSGATTPTPADGPAPQR